MRGVHSEDYPINLESLRKKCRELGINSETQYRTKCMNFNLPYMPNITYKEEWEKKGGWAYLFPTQKIEHKKSLKQRNTVIPEPKVPSITRVEKKVRTTKPTKESIEESLPMEQDENGILTFISIIIKLRKLKIRDMKTYRRFCCAFTDFPKNPEEYYSDWVDEKFFFQSPLKTVLEKLK